MDKDVERDIYPCVYLFAMRISVKSMLDLIFLPLTAFAQSQKSNSIPLSSMQLLESLFRQAQRDVFFNAEYLLPEEIRQRELSEVNFRAHEGSVVGGLYDARLIKEVSKGGDSANEQLCINLPQLYQEARRNLIST